MTFSEIKKIAEPLIKGMMLDLGFKTAKYYYFKEINKDYRIEVNFNEVGQGKGYYDVIPFIGLKNKKADTILLELIPDLTFPSTHALALGYVTKNKQYRSWYFTPDNNYPEVVSEIKYNLVKYGIPYLENIIANPILHADRCRARLGVPYGFYFTPVLYYVAGDIDKCKSYLDRSIKEYYENPELEVYRNPKVISLDYLKFRDKLLQYIEDYK